MRSGYPFYLALVFALALTPGCSSSPTNSDGLPIEGESMHSGADAVGSIPEDMLASEESSGEAVTGIPAAEDAPSGDPTDLTASATPTADPFADLTEGTAVDESSGEASAGVATTGETATYVVKPGDTLMKIAFSIYGDIDRWKDLHEWNRGKVKSVSRLHTGTKLTYETPVHAFSAEELGHSYTIKQGDTLANIADEVYGRKMKYRKLQNYNKSLIKNANRIFAGFTIYYDITAQEMAEAEQRRQERAAGGPPPVDTSIPSAISPPNVAPSAPAPLAVSPSPPGPASTQQ